MPDFVASDKYPESVLKVYGFELEPGVEEEEDEDELRGVDESSCWPLAFPLPLPLPLPGDVESEESVLDFVVEFGVVAVLELVSEEVLPEDEP